MKNKFTLTITTGRTGTNFLYGSLNKYSNSDSFITHELFDSDITLPRLNWRVFEPSNLRGEKIRKCLDIHVDTIEQNLDKNPILELGWSLSHLVPYYYHRLGDRLKILHLVRHPIMHSCSRTTAGRYHFLDPIRFSGNLYPFERGMNFSSYTEKWSSMNSFEKNLYRWMEYTQYAQEIKNRFERLEFKCVKSENLFDKPKKCIREIADYAGIEGNFNQTSLNAINKNKAKNTFKLFFPLRDDWKKYSHHNKVYPLAERLEYEFNSEKLKEKINKKYEDMRAHRSYRHVLFGPFLRFLKERNRFFADFMRYRRLTD